MNAAAIRTLQTRLALAGHRAGPADGLLGPRTGAAIRASLAARADAPGGWTGWPAPRRAVGLLQLMARDAGIDPGPVDGLWGPRTAAAAEALAAETSAPNPPGPNSPAPAVPEPRSPEPSIAAAAAVLPGSTADARTAPIDAPRPVARPAGAEGAPWPRQGFAAMTGFYGPNGLPGGHTPPLVRVPCPWPLRLAWESDTVVGAIAIHERCADSLARILARVRDRYGPAEIARLGLDRFGGSYAARRMRGGSRWSTHAWAAAIDWEPARNRLTWRRDRAMLAHPDAEDWWRIWEEEGWLSLGRARDFDWMHVQAARL
ncbi:hypothetical protein M1105_15110 [Limibaculum sp. FT325]|uniref:hypothetical protein n=1 Tax=Thermohalobaculum sediminis TaxID=2939436 RepID=UPI0020BE76CE|nr:hypothetical protein [Limibaculum sediminis]MCL5778312.1 hypothetical protein [Limibaculum sediminis]